MSCEAVRELLPDYTLGTLPEPDAEAVRRHLRGCSACRSEAAALDEGVALFTSAAHVEEPPAELRDRVMAVLADEWAEAPAAARFPRRTLAYLAVAAALAVAVGSMVWAGLAQSRTGRLEAQASLAEQVKTEARSYRNFLEALGGRDVRVATLRPVGTSTMQGAAVLYDSEQGQSWVLVLLRSPGASGTARVTISGGGQSIELHEVELADDGDGATWLVTSSDISRVNNVQITDAQGTVLASGIAAHGDEE